MLYSCIQLYLSPETQAGWRGVECRVHVGRQYGHYIHSTSHCFADSLMSHPQNFKWFLICQLLAQTSKKPKSTNTSGCFKSTNISGHFKSTNISGHFKSTNISGHFKSPHLGRIFGCLDTDRWLDSLHPRHLKRFVKSQFTMFISRTRKKRPKVMCCAKLPLTQNAKDVSKIA